MDFETGVSDGTGFLQLLVVRENRYHIVGTLLCLLPYGKALLGSGNETKKGK
jgi:hypothetical protein